MNTNLSQTTDDSELKRSLARLSYVGMGLSSELDSALEKLRQVVKADASEREIKREIDQISKILVSLEDSAHSGRASTPAATPNLLELLLKQKLPNRLKLELKKAHAKTTQLDALEVADSIVQAIERFLRDMGDRNEVAKVGLFGKVRNFFGFLQSTRQVALEVEAEPIPEELKKSLQMLLNQLAAMDTYSEVAARLGSKVERLTFVSELAGVLELITSAFVEVAGHEHQQFENFLKSLGKRIDKVNAFIDSTVSYSQQVKDESLTLDRELQQSVGSIKSSVESSTSLGEVKSAIYQKMDNIVGRFDEFCRLQERNHKSLTGNLEQLRDQLKATEDESSRLKDELAEQKIRAQTDPLTLLPNRYSYNERLTQEYNRWRRYRSPLSLVIGDIDHFKKINDQYGHTVGDAVLKSVAMYLQEELRESDFIARFGGEEFIILLPETSLIDATKAINKLRQGIKQVKTTFENQSIQVAVSFGISEFENNDTPKAVFKRADDALYRAKDKGRDQVCCQRASSEQTVKSH